MEEFLNKIHASYLRRAMEEAKGVKAEAARIVAEGVRLKPEQHAESLKSMKPDKGQAEREQETVPAREQKGGAR